MPKPNILIIMSDEHAPMYSSVYGHPIVQTPNMERLAQAGATFDAAYCNSPLCTPSRMSFMTGRYINKIGTWDNVTPLRSDQVTWAHRLRKCRATMSCCPASSTSADRISCTALSGNWRVTCMRSGITRFTSLG